MKIALIGYGKMGKAIERLALNAGHDIVARVGRGPESETPLPTNTDVAIEFTRPDAAAANIQACAEQGIPVVCGTTGWYRQLSELSAIIAQNQGALLYAPNFSIGVNLFMEVNRVLARLMSRQPQYRAELSEIHHTEKLDAPSGTAIALADDLIANHNGYSSWSHSGTAKNNELPITAMREPGVPGTHSLTYSSPCDEINLTHTALNRDGFASGALYAAEWLKGKTGIFTMKDVLNLNQLT
ncbi:MAG: 4-hydroxy-tetrahydrodipicolinate reductase [Cryomorphaceae bacterium]|nr:MAG: 4-hydroxy-tetrahydrodipicolinate reductase [Cryomorphaceae bacterium]